MAKMDEDRTIILGGGLSGLSAACTLARAGRGVTVLERDSAVGGISQTVEHRGFRFDLGPHRFFTKSKPIEAFVRDLMGDELIVVPRKTEIFIRGKYFDYPLEPVNAVFGMGLFMTLRILLDYGLERVKRLVREPVPVSLEDWVVAHFGRTLFDIYFKQYSEKIWGIGCDTISAEWVARRIRGLSLSSAVMNAFFRMKGRDIPSLVSEFLYPRLGIGRISERLREETEGSGGIVSTGSRVERINRTGNRVSNVVVRTPEGSRIVEGADFVSSIPVTKLIDLLDPAPSDEVLTARAGLKFRDLVVVAVLIDRPRVTDQTWIYIPEKDIPIGRIHEPTNWSPEMAPVGKTLLVTEFFCFEDDDVWSLPDERLAEIAVDSLERLGYIRRDEVTASVVKRAPKAYPLFDIGYRRRLEVLYEYLDRFENLRIAGRAGMFKYFNMDHAIESGISAAEALLRDRNAASAGVAG